MSLHHNPLRDDVNMENYMALYLAIKGYIPKGKTKRKYPSAKEALSLLNILTTDDKTGEDKRWNK